MQKAVRKPSESFNIFLCTLLTYLKPTNNRLAASVKVSKSKSEKRGINIKCLSSLFKTGTYHTRFKCSDPGISLLFSIIIVYI